jgi:hypothetical protein
MMLTHGCLLLVLLNYIMAEIVPPVVPPKCPGNAINDDNCGTLNWAALGDSW